MGISYKSQKCPNCGSKDFTFIKEINMWECVYCGTKIERHEEADSLFGIKNVVRQVLIDVAYRRFSEAKNNLIECEKIDSRYVGTTTASICYLLNYALFGGVTKQEKSNMFSQIKRLYSELKRINSSISEEEAVLYESLSSAEAYGVLILAFDALGSGDRVEEALKYYKPEESYSLTLNAQLLSYTVKNNLFEYTDKLISNQDSLEKKSALSFLLSSYPDSQSKALNCNKIISSGSLSGDDRGIIESYLKTSGDSLEVKYDIACEALKSAASPTVNCVMETVVSSLTDSERIKNIFDIILSKKLVDGDIYTIIEYSLSQCTQEVILYVLKLFKESSQFVVFKPQYFNMILSNGKISFDYKTQIINEALEFNVNEKTKDGFISYYLNYVKDTFENRERMIDYLFSLVSTISTASAEYYIVVCTIDGDNKPAVVEKIFNLNVNRSFFRETLDKYIVQSKDSPQTNSVIIDILLKNGLAISEEALSRLLVRNDIDNDTKLGILKKAIRVSNGYFSLLDRYFAYTNPNMFSENIFRMLLTITSSVSAASVNKYLFTISDKISAKAQYASELISKCKTPVAIQQSTISFLNSSVECNIVQAYILANPDSPNTAVVITNALRQYCNKLNTDIYVSGEKKKFKKYLSSVRGSLNQSTVAAASQAGLL